MSCLDGLLAHLGGIGALGNMKAPHFEGWQQQIQGSQIPEHMRQGQQAMATAWWTYIKKERADRELEIHEVQL